MTRQRAALAISNDNKVVYGAFASFCDHAADKSRGWIMGWDSQTLKPIAAAITDHRAPARQALRHLASCLDLDVWIWPGGRHRR